MFLGEVLRCSGQCPAKPWCSTSSLAGGERGAVLCVGDTHICGVVTDVNREFCQARGIPELCPKGKRAAKHKPGTGLASLPSGASRGWSSAVVPIILQCSQCPDYPTVLPIILQFSRCPDYPTVLPVSRLSYSSPGVPIILQCSWLSYSSPGFPALSHSSCYPSYPIVLPVSCLSYSSPGVPGLSFSPPRCPAVLPVSRFFCSSGVPTVSMVLSMSRLSHGYPCFSRKTRYPGFSSVPVS